MPRNIVGSQIRKLRDAKGWSQEMFAARCNRIGWDISRGTLAKIEAQIRCVTDSELQILGAALGVRVDELYTARKR